MVREGDNFECLPFEGGVRHEFGQGRGRTLGAYGSHAPQAFRPAAVFVDSQEFLPFSGRLHITFFA